MKKNVVIICLLLCFNAVYSQIQVGGTEGQVRVGPTWLGGPVTGYDLTVGRFFQVQCYPATPIYIENYLNAGCNDPIMRCMWGNTAWLGNSSYPMWKVYSYQYFGYNTGIYSYSDSETKENIKPLENALDKIIRINTIRYDTKAEVYKNTPEYRKNKIEEHRKNKIGFIAQELQEIVPEIVSFDDDAQLYAVDYAGLVPVLVQAIQEQQKMIKNLEAEVEKLKNKKP